MASLVELAAMRRAIAFSAFGIGATSPNPQVGCVILDTDGRVVGEGYHQRKGQSHAEVNALAAAGDRARRGTAVVTLEPCNHHGRTPPCHQALLDSGVVRTVIGVIDPTSRGEGGAARLREAGVDVEVGVLAHEVLLVLGPWLASLRTARPQVVWPYVVNPDGTSGSLGAIPYAECILRAMDVVLHEDGVVDEAIPGSHSTGILSFSPVALYTGPRPVLTTLYQRGMRSVILNGGPILAAPFLRDGLIDRIMVHLASDGPSTQPPSDADHVSLLPPGFRLAEVTRHGPYVQLIGLPESWRGPYAGYGPEPCWW